MATAWLGLGSNVSADINIRAGIGELQATFGKVALSPVYGSKAVGFSGDDFINLAARVETAMSPLELRDYLHDLEDRHGRKRDVPKFSDRSLDIDILLYGNLELDTAELQLPRAEILSFAHVLRPLADLAPGLTYPGLTRTLGSLWLAMSENAPDLVRLDDGPYRS